MGQRRRTIAVIDAETDPFAKGRIPRPFLWGYYNGDKYEEFEDIDELVDFLAPQRLIVYAHNGGRFDYHFLWHRIAEGTELTVINGRVAKFKIGECEFRDSWNLLPIPLGAMQKDEIDYRIFEANVRNKPENRKKISNYLYGDCLYLWNWLTQFIEEYGLHLTTAGTAMKRWTIISGRKPPEDMGGILYNELRSFYYGGRCESFYSGETAETFELADINSAYPYAMLHAHPISTFPLSGEGMAEWKELHIEHRQASFVIVRGRARGCFPYRLTDGSLVFPDDNELRTYHVTGWELLAAQRTKTFELTELVEFTYFDELTDFADYVNYFYQMKSAAPKKSPAYTFAKLLMNALYGKFGSNPDEYREYMVTGWWAIDDSGQAGEWQFNCELGDEDDGVIVSRPQPEEKQKFYNIATAASITGFVRAFLWEAICNCEGVLYCDTDSIAARDVSKLDYGEALGQWDLEGRFDYGAFGGKKLYAMHYEGKPRTFSLHDKKTWGNWKIATKGFKATPKDIIRVAQGKTFLYEPEVPTFSIHAPPRFINRSIKKRPKKVATVEDK